MAELLQEIADYWETRTEGYSQVNHKELEGKQKNAWLSVLEAHFPKKKKEDLRILDIGTGPGFFPMILSMAGYHVTAVDYTEGMLAKAKENLLEEGCICGQDLLHRVTFYQMNAQRLDFADQSFDVVISRNLTWNLEHPKQAYEEWYRVLAGGGVLLNFDANWYGYLYDEKKRKAFLQDRLNVEQQALEDHYLCTDMDWMEEIALQIPLSAVTRPSWDLDVLSPMGFELVMADMDIWKWVWSEEEMLNYGSTPMFMIYGVKE